MSRGAFGILGGIAWLALGAAGCAKHHSVKADAPLAAAVKAPHSQGGPREAVGSAVIAGPANAPQIPDAPVAQETLEPIPQAAALIALEKIYFVFDSATLSEDAREALARNAALVRKEPGLKIRIEGHCDERGSDEYNLALGEKRARAALRYLAALGIPADELSVISFGDEKPLDPGHNEAAWRVNRRDEFGLER